MPTNVAAAGAATTATVDKSLVYPSWEYAVLSAIGAPAGTAQLQTLNFWARSEGMPANTNNWLAITESYLNEWGTIGDSSKNVNTISPGVWNSENVVVYPTLSTGVNALASFLQHGHTGIIKAFQDPNATVESITKAIAKDGGWNSDPTTILQIAGLDPNLVPIYKNGATTGDVTSQDPGVNFTQCNTGGPVLGWGGVLGVGGFTILDSCQAKALVGGLLVGVGGLIMAGGITIIVGNQVGPALVSDFILKGLKKVPVVNKGLSSSPRTVSSDTEPIRTVSSDTEPMKYGPKGSAMTEEELGIDPKMRHNKRVPKGSQD